MATLAAHHYGSAYNQDKLTVYNIITRNIANGSDAFTYVNPHIKKEDGRRKTKANNRKGVNEETAFETGSTGANFVEAIKAASERGKVRKDRKKVR